MQSFIQYLSEAEEYSFSKGEGSAPDHTKNPFHSTLTKHGFKHVKSTEGPYKGSEWHHYEHPEKGKMQATVYPKKHSFGETHWRHSHPGEGKKSSSAGRTAKSLHDYLSHSEGSTAKIRGVHHSAW